ncbi:F-box protein [Legionella israelensis]|uniref:F-box domain-containing protein n=1 Tax=Legionella israelensis TaxID=454 RepID=A0A0W0W687_9GAMM|nr:F-box protein [Legionella israelensis]KTD27863.1 hypothetical protein Lisr_0959 [Legionella israelensis]QBS09737.1 F-box domain-containing protein [Legionella israelensis]SCY54630.1 F-box domain-containing protein [Legionella israelensis DSM 19235]STX59275.1 Uncharacterised protein [Legionella israelensis]
MTKITDLPTDPILEIFQFMSPKDVVHFLSTNKQYRQFDESPNFWKVMLKIHFPDYPVSSENKELDFKKVFKSCYKSLVPESKYHAVMNIKESPDCDKDMEPGKFFQQLVTLFNQNINQTNPGPHIHIAENGKPLSSHTVVGGGFHAILELALPENFSLEFESCNGLYIPKEQITIDNIVSCDDTVNPLRKAAQEPAKDMDLDVMKSLLKGISIKTKQQMNYFLADKSRLVSGLFKKATGQEKTNVELNKEMEKIIEESKSVMDLLKGVHTISQQAYESAFGNFTKGLKDFFNAIGIKNYDRKDSMLDFLKKCQEYELISTVPLESFPAASK